jgi:hypothetical protein
VYMDAKVESMDVSEIKKIIDYIIMNA